MNYKKLDSKKGVAGLEIFLSVIATLFMIGIIVMVFTIAGTRLYTAITETTDGGTLYNESMTLTHFLNRTAAGDDTRFYSMTIITIVNATVPDGNAAMWSIDSGNYTITGASLNLTQISSYDEIIVNITYSWDYTTTTEAMQTINDTYVSIGESVDWFSTFIVLAALVVLILLVVIIINSIRTSGITSGA